MTSGDTTHDLDVDPDDYASAAVDDTPATSDRTNVTEADFEATRAGYRAKIDTGDLYSSLPQALPQPTRQDSDSDEKTKLNKKHVQLVTAAAGELYFYQRYNDLLAMISWLRRNYNSEVEKDKKGLYAESLQRWEERCKSKISEKEGVNK